MSFKLYEIKSKNHTSPFPIIKILGCKRASINTKALELIREQIGNVVSLYVDPDGHQVGFGKPIDADNSIQIPKRAAAVRGIYGASVEAGLKPGSYVLEKSTLAPVSLRIRAKEGR